MKTCSIGMLSVSFACLLSAAAVTSAAAQPAAQQVRIDADDIGGVVTSAEGPEAGVWVIAETARPADEITSRSSPPMIRAAIFFPICRRRITTSGCAATVSSIHRR